jgi:hypothetical protein
VRRGIAAGSCVSSEMSTSTTPNRTNAASTTHGLDRLATALCGTMLRADTVNLRLRGPQ